MFPAIVAGCDQLPARQIEKRIVALRSSSGSSQLRAILASGNAVTRGEMLPEGAGEDTSRHLPASSDGFLLEPHPMEPQPALAASAPAPRALDLCINSLRLIFLTFMKDLSFVRAHCGAQFVPIELSVAELHSAYACCLCLCLVDRFLEAVTFVAVQRERGQSLRAASQTTSTNSLLQIA